MSSDDATEAPEPSGRANGGRDDPAGAADDADTVTVRELQERSNKSTWRIVTVGIAIIVAVFVLLGFVALSNTNSRDELTNPPVNSSGASEAVSS